MLIIINSTPLVKIKSAFIKQIIPRHLSTNLLIIKFLTPDGFLSTSGTVKEGLYDIRQDG